MADLAMAENGYLDVELHVMGSRRARLQCPNRQEYSDEIRLDEDLLQRLLELEHSKDFDGYGQALFAAAFPVGSDLHRGIYSVLDSSRRDEQQLRFRLNIDGGAPTELHALHWELLADGRDFAVGRSPVTVFSRYVSRPHPFGQSPTKPRMLCVIAAPIDVHRYQMAPIDYDYTLRKLEQCFADLRAGLEIDYLERPVTPERLRDALKRRRYDLLHIHGHGTLPRRGESALVLENNEHKACFTTESAVRGVLLGLGDLKLITLVACHGGQASLPDEHLSGLAGSLVRQNVPAVIAMRRAISMSVAFRFTRHFYHQLAERPCVDAAVNEARHRLYMDDPGGVDWSSPVLYMRLEDGLLWSAKKRTSPRRWKTAVTAVSLLVALTSILLILVQSEWTTEAPVETPVDLGSEAAIEVPPQTDEAVEDRVPLPAPPPPTQSKKETVTAIEKGKVWVAAVDYPASSWSDSVTRLVLRQLRAQRPGLNPVVLPEAFRSSLSALLGDDLSILPGGTMAPGGVEYIYIVMQSYESLPLRGPTRAVSVSCDVVVISAREPRIVFQETIGHTGNSNTENGALEQAFDRCVSSSNQQVP